jgi:energy-coupling factor transporter transmembrane protein EcfT
LGINDEKLINYFSISQAGISLRFTMRFALLLSVFASLNRLHDMQRYGRVIGLTLSKLPFGTRLFSQIELIATLALRMIPFIQKQHFLLNLAIKARGEKTAPGLKGQLFRLRKLMFPLITQSLYRADRTAIALQVRGYDPTVKRTMFHESTISSRAIITGSGFILLVCLTVFIFNR